MNKYWFKPKCYGYGITPKSWEGWLSTFSIAGIIILSAYSHSFFTVSGPNLMQISRFLIDVLFIVTLSMLLLFPKTEGKIQWNWGKRR